MSVLVTILKLLSTTLAGAFGILALAVEYKHEGNITKWGKIALAGILVSTAIAIVTQSLEFLSAEFDARKSALEARARLEQSERILQNLNTLTRASQPLGNPEFTVVLDFPKELPQGSRFLSDVEHLASSVRSMPPTEETYSQGFIVNSRGSDGTPRSIKIYPTWPGFPTKASEPELYTFLTQTSVEFSFLKNTEEKDSDIANFRKSREQPRLGYHGDIGDLAFGIGGGGEPQTRTLDYDLQKKALSIWIEGSAVDRFVRRSGGIISIPDFDESIPLLAVDHTMVPSLNAGDFPALRKARNEMTPRIVLVSVSGRRYVLRNWQSHENLDGYRMFSGEPLQNGQEANGTKSASAASRHK
ncbi:MAG TPA: hypothetical protein PL000_20170 [Anaerolineales bacterium]|nr:hypothetical protein [Anaerolineales bacterium]